MAKISEPELENLIKIYISARDQLLDTIINYHGVGTKVYANTILKQLEKQLTRMEKQSAFYVRSVIPAEYQKALNDLYAYFQTNHLLMNPPAVFASLHNDAIYGIAREMQYQIGQGLEQVGRQIIRYVDDARDNALRATGLEATGEKFASGSTIRQMRDNMIKKLQNEGFMTVQYGSGSKAYQVPIDTYATMVSRSTTREAGNIARENQLTANGYDLVEMTTHYPTCPICAQFQGRVFSISGNDKRFPPLSRAFQYGYHNVHPNCRHSVHAWVEGLQDTEEIQDAIDRSNAPFDDSRSDDERALYNKQQAQNRQIRQDRYQYERYKARIPDNTPKTFSGFRRIKKTGGSPWIQLQENYRCTGIIERLLSHYPDAVVVTKPEDILPQYLDASRKLTPDQKDGLFHYTHYPEGVKMNKFLGGIPGISLSAREMINLNIAADALNHMRLPHTTVLWRGTDERLLKGFELIKDEPISEWKDWELHTDGFTSTSILRSTSYDKEIQMVILTPKDITGAGYINEISYNKAHVGETEGGHILKEEYEVLLQKASKYSILEAQKFNGKTILVVKWDGYDG